MSEEKDNRKVFESIICDPEFTNLVDQTVDFHGCTGFEPGLETKYRSIAAFCFSALGLDISESENASANKKVDAGRPDIFIARELAG